jgi:phosphohistidine phosphatase
MKYLLLLRHAKSSWKNPMLGDFERPLSKRGKADAQLMGRWMAARKMKPDAIISSLAVRARCTAEILVNQMHCDDHILLFDVRIYEAVCETLLDLVRNLSETWQDVFLVGHNPGFTELANRLTPCYIDNIATCGVVRIEFPIASWNEVVGMSGLLQFYDHPRKNLVKPGSPELLTATDMLSNYLQGKETNVPQSLIEVKGIGPATAKLLADQGITSIEDLALAKLGAVTAVQGFSEIRAARVIDAAKALLQGSEGAKEEKFSQAKIAAKKVGDKPKKEKKKEKRKEKRKVKTPANSVKEQKKKKLDKKSKKKSKKK